MVFDLIADDMKRSVISVERFERVRFCIFTYKDAELAGQVALCQKLVAIFIYGEVLTAAVSQWTLLLIKAGSTM